jgi:alpha-1,3-glucosyltransferase
MELTYNLNASEWYTNNDDYNPIDYCPLDYPPLSGYYSLVWGYIFSLLLPKSIELKSSWGFESPNHKILMRISVIVSDIIFFHIPVYLLSKMFTIDEEEQQENIVDDSIIQYKLMQKHEKFYWLQFLFLCSPILIIIDHGHFQYNCVMHGLFLFSLYFLYKEYFIVSIFFFSLCINFKQMGMYYSMPLPFYVIKVLYDKFKKQELKKSMCFMKIALYALCTMLSMLIIWSPWINDNKYQDVLIRIFPLWRGIFEDKVASFWCTLNIFYKIQKVPQIYLIWLSFFFTLIPSLITSISILIKKDSTKEVTNLAFFIVSMSFFFFSFHVHEKTILVPYLAYIINFYALPEFLFSFSLMGMFSLYPLLKREGQVITYSIFMIFFSTLIKEIQNKYVKENKDHNCSENYLYKFLNFLEIFNVIFIIIFHLCEQTISPPANYPWLYPMINAAFSFLNFFLFYILANMRFISLIKKDLEAILSRNDDAKKDVAINEEVMKDGSKYDEPPKEEPPKEDHPKEDPPRDEVLNEEAKNEEQNNREPINNIEMPS